MAYFPADIVADILSRMPVKQLLRFRSVCKTWVALIDSKHFTKLHLHRSIDIKKHRKIILSIDRCVHLFSLDSLDVAEKIALPLVDADYVSFSDSCNGLVLLCTSDNSVIAFWNPSTRTCQVIPPRPTPKPYLYDAASVSRWYPFKLGYDAVNDDYKVVKFSQFKYCHSNAFISNFHVYSMKSNSWRTVQDFPYCICFCYERGQGRDAVLAHGALHWFVGINNVDDGFAIAAFHLSTETTRLVPLPDLGGVKKVYMDLVALEGCLSIVAYVGTFRSLGSFLGVWVMNDYGVGESWNKLISPPQLSVLGLFRSVLPLAYSTNGGEVLLLQNNEEFFWFNLQHNAVRKIEVQGLPSYFQAKVYVQNLLRLGLGGKIVPKDKMIGMKRYFSNCLHCIRFRMFIFF